MLPGSATPARHTKSCHMDFSYRVLKHIKGRSMYFTATCTRTVQLGTDLQACEDGELGAVDSCDVLRHPLHRGRCERGGVRGPLGVGLEHL